MKKKSLTLFKISAAFPVIIVSTRSKSTDVALAWMFSSGKCNFTQNVSCDVTRTHSKQSMSETMECRWYRVDAELEESLTEREAGTSQNDTRYYCGRDHRQDKYQGWGSACQRAQWNNWKSDELETFQTNAFRDILLRANKYRLFRYLCRWRCLAREPRRCHTGRRWAWYLHLAYSSGSDSGYNSDTPQSQLPHDSPWLEHIKIHECHTVTAKPLCFNLGS